MAATDFTAAWNAAVENLKAAVQQCVEAGKDVMGDVKSEVLQIVEAKLDEDDAAEDDGTDEEAQ